MLMNMIIGNIEASKPILVASFSSNETEAIINAAVLEAERLHREYEELRVSPKSAFVGKILALAAYSASLYRALCPYTDSYNAMNVLQRCVEILSDAAKYGSDEAKEFFSDVDRVRNNALAMVSENEKIPAGEYRFVYRNHEWDKEKQLYAFDVLECPALKFLNKVGLPEVCRCLCNYDHHQAQFLPGGVKLRRYETIASGGKKCDMNYYFSK